MFQHSASQSPSPILDSQHLDLRKNLPSLVQSQLLPIARIDWSNHLNYGGSAAFFIQYHNNLLNTAHFITNELMALLSKLDLTHSNDETLKQILRAGVYLVDKAHHHHQIEDSVYLPQFRKALPSFNVAMDLLDSDHKILDKALHVFRSHLNKLFIQKNVSEQSLNALYQQAKGLQNRLKRHLHDEEEVIIPIFLMHS